jgi:oxygen-independent coproporphyrinogen-3 oxidase
MYESELAYHYKNALIEEINMVGKSLNSKKKVTSLYFGGGTPALLADYIEELVTTVKKYYIIDEGIGVELHPENVNVETLTKLKAAGVTKISIGIQSFNKETLVSIGRKEINQNIMFESLRQVPFETVSMDLIFAIPGQTSASLIEDINIAFANGANHIAIYPFIQFSFANNSVQPMSEKAKRKLLEDITAYCQEQGYVRTSIWTFAKADTVKYSSMTRDNFLGFGCSATTLLTDQFKINTFSVAEYINRIKQNKLPTSLTLRFSLRQRMVYYLFWMAYTTKVDPKDFRKFFGKSLKREYGLEFFVCRILGFLKKENGVYRMTTKGAYYYHYFEQFYTLAYIDKMWHVMSKKAFPERIYLDGDRGRV